MPDRSVVVRLEAITAGYDAEMAKAGAATEAAMGRATKSVLDNHAAWGKLGRGVRDAGLAVGVGIAAAVKEAADFNAKMALVQTLSHSNESQMRKLSAAAKSAGLDFGFTANQVADAEAELIKAGVSVKDILGGGLKGALTLASAGQLDVGQSAEIAASAMAQFKLQGKDIPHIADLLAAAADKAQGNLDDMGYALEQAGTTAHQSGLSIEQTTGTLAAFAHAGLIGERGGTTFKQMLLQLEHPAKDASALMDKYNLSLYNANGQIKTMPELAGNLQRAFEHLTPAQRNSALATIFGSRAIQGANILMGDGQKVIAQWIKKVDAQGFAAHQASGKLNSLEGDLTKLKAAGENAFIDLGSGAVGAPLRHFVQDTTSEIEKLTKSGDLRRWGKEIGHDIHTLITDATPMAKELGHALGTIGSAVGHIVTDFNKLPPGVQQTLVTSSAVGFRVTGPALPDCCRGGRA